MKRNNLKETFRDENSGNVFDLDDVVDYYAPHITIDPEKAIIEYVRNRARRFVAMRDENGNRVFVSYKHEGRSVYANPTVSHNVESLALMEKQLKAKIKGTIKTHRIVKRRRQQELSGQVSIFEEFISV